MFRIVWMGAISVFFIFAFFFLMIRRPPRSTPFPTRRSSDLARLLDRQRGLVCDLVERRLAAELHPERALGAVHLLHPLHDVDRHSDRPSLVGERAGDRLTNPPGRVGRELVAAAPVELLDGADEAEGAFLDQI